MRKVKELEIFIKEKFKYENKNVYLGKLTKFQEDFYSATFFGCHWR